MGEISGVDVMRHGESPRKQGKVEFNEAGDLNLEKIKEVEESAEELAELIGPDEEVRIWASPFGRTMQTAKILSRKLREKGVAIREGGLVDDFGEDSGIKIFERFEEVKNYRWDIYGPLVNGGEIEFEGKKYEVNKEESNPEGFNNMQYFTSEKIRDFVETKVETWPDGLIKKLKEIESLSEATRRIVSGLEKIESVKNVNNNEKGQKRNNQKNCRVIIVTHNGLVSFFTGVLSEGEKLGVKPAGFVSLEKNENGKLEVKDIFEPGIVSPGAEKTNQRQM